jgi:hypothetical protein
MAMAANPAKIKSDNRLMQNLLVDQWPSISTHPAFWLQTRGVGATLNFGLCRKRKSDGENEGGRIRWDIPGSTSTSRAMFEGKPPTGRMSSYGLSLNHLLDDTKSKNSLGLDISSLDIGAE